MWGFDVVYWLSLSKQKNMAKMLGPDQQGWLAA
jgi:hypothetical protein